MFARFSFLTLLYVSTCTQVGWLTARQLRRYSSHYSQTPELLRLRLPLAVAVAVAMLAMQHQNLKQAMQRQNPKQAMQRQNPKQAMPQQNPKQATLLQLLRIRRPLLHPLRQRRPLSQ